MKKVIATLIYKLNDKEYKIIDHYKFYKKETEQERKEFIKKDLMNIAPQGSEFIKLVTI